MLQILIIEEIIALRYTSGTGAGLPIRAIGIL